MAKFFSDFPDKILYWGFPKIFFLIFLYIYYICSLTLNSIFIQFVADERNAHNKKSQKKKVGTGVGRLVLKTPAMLKQPYRYDPDVHREDDIVRDIGEARRDSDIRSGLFFLVNI